MSAAAQFGLLLGVAIVAVSEVAPQPVGWVVFCTVWAMAGTWSAVICWRRTGLPYATASMVEGAFTMALLAVLAATGRVLPGVAPPIGWFIVHALSVVAGTLLLWVESKKNPERWRAWRDYVERVTLWDVLRGRHIPDLRSSRT
jgi:hypothetical protein